jgi:hypothetical protein
MGARVVALLEPVIGPEHVRVNVALKLNPATVQQTEESYDPSTVVRSKQSTSDSTTSATPGGGSPACGAISRLRRRSEETGSRAGNGANATGPARRGHGKHLRQQSLGGNRQLRNQSPARRDAASPGRDCAALARRDRR